MILSGHQYKATRRGGSFIPCEPGRFAAIVARFKDGETVTVTISRARVTRTLDQNARMWAILTVFEEWGWTKSEAKEWACAKFLPPIVREFPDGTRVETTRGTSGLSTIEMSSFMDEIENFLRDQGVDLS